MTSSNVTPDVLLNSLMGGATKRTANSLQIIDAICREQYEAGNPDFSIATIGRVSSMRGGPSPQSIRNATGEHYRALLAAWAYHAGATKRKPPLRAEPGVADDVLDMISDAAVRALVGSFLAENRKLKAENGLLKKQAQIVIDRRPRSKLTEPASKSGVQVLSPLSSLLPAEVDALRDCISDELVARMGWTIDRKTGRVTKGGLSIFRAGFVTAIKKVLDAASN